MRKLRRLALAARASVIELLEQRSLLSAVIGPDGTLTIIGTAQADEITVSFNPVFNAGQTETGEVSLYDNGDTYGFDARAVKRLVINGGDGNDSISVNGTETDVNDPKAAALNFVINDGNGMDNISSYIGDTGFLTNHVLAPTASITAGDGNDTLFASGGTDAQIVAGNGNDSIIATGGNDPMTIALTEGNGNDYILADNQGKSTLTINAAMGVGLDTYNSLDNPETFVYAHTTEGQTSGALPNQVLLSGHVFVGQLVNSEPGIAVQLQSTNGFLTPGNLVTTSDVTGDYSFKFAAPSAAALSYTATLNTPNFISSTPQRDIRAGNGFGSSGNDFALIPLGTAANPRLIGTAGSYYDQGNTIANAVDGNVGTFFDAPIASGGYVGLDYGSPQVVKQISYSPRIKFAARMIGGLFQGSNSSDFSNAVTLYEVTASPVVGQLTTVHVSPSKGAFRYVRYIGPTNSYCNIAEMEVTLATKLTGTPIGTAGSYQSKGNTIANAFDGNLSTFFDAPSPSGDWVGLDLGTAKVVDEIRFAPRVGYESRMVGGEFQASNSATFSTGVVTLAIVTTKVPAGMLTTFPNNTTAYRYYRYIGPANSYCNIAELEFDG